MLGLETEQQLTKTSFQLKQSSKDRGEQKRWEMFAERRLWKIMEIRQKAEGWRGQTGKTE